MFMNAIRTWAASLAAAAITAAAGTASAGPPYLTDDPQPTDFGHWEIYNFVTGRRSPGGLDGEAGIDLNYGGYKNLQLTVVLPLGFSDARGFSVRGLRGATGVVELAAKYKLIHRDGSGASTDISVFPRLYVPTSRRFGPRRANLLLPVWAEKDWGPWSLFGGGGFQINPGPDQRNFWQGGIALNRALGKRLSTAGNCTVRRTTAATEAATARSTLQPPTSSSSTGRCSPPQVPPGTPRAGTARPSTYRSRRITRVGYGRQRGSRNEPFAYSRESPLSGSERESAPGANRSWRCTAPAISRRNSIPSVAG